MIEVTAPVLAGQRFLHGMRVEHLDALGAAAWEVYFPAGHRIFSDGGHVDKFWLIQSGRVLLDVQVPGESPAIIGTVGIGELLGWSWLLPPYQWAFGAVCATEVRAVEFDAEEIRALCAGDPSLRQELTERIFRVLARRLLDTKVRLVTGHRAGEHGDHGGHVGFRVPGGQRDDRLAPRRVQRADDEVGLAAEA
jgi:CRP/FNR family transcriptional regulator, cyclic AMP receptor protein